MTARFGSVAPHLVGAALAALLLTPLGTPAQEQTSPDERLAMWRDHAAMTESTLFKHLPWQFLGPANISGRMTDIAVVEPRGENYTVYVAGASGGVWKTVNEGVTWEPVFQHEMSTSIGDVTVAPSDPDIVWVGTGEANIFRSSMAGAGVYKSTDAGATWRHMGLVGTNTIPRIVVHPTNPDIVYVAASGHEWTWNEERGLYKSADGGETWEKILHVNDQTGVIDLVMDPTDPSRLYAATWQRIRRRWNDPRVEPGFSHSGIWRTDDAGANWTQINDGLPTPEHRGRIGIDVARSNPIVVYAFVDNYEVAREPEPGATDAYGRPASAVIKGSTVYRSDDRGESWRRTSEETRYMEGLGGTYGWVFGQMRVDPNDEDRIYVMGLSLNVSEDQGRTFRRLTGMHGDHHGLWIDPANSDFLVNVNDGGVAFSYDGGDNWRLFLDGELPLVQFFNVGHDMDDPFRVYGSIQDHGSYRGVVDLSRGRHNIPTVEWESAPGGEGSTHAIDPTDPTVVYSAGFYGRISRSDLDSGERAAQLVPQAPEGELAYRGQWLAPFIISPHNPRILYHGMNYLFRSWDRGDGWDRISEDLTRNDMAQLGDIPFQTIFSISESPLRFGLVYAGTDDGRIHVTRNGGDTWTEITAGTRPGLFAAELVASRYDLGTVYLAQNGKRHDDFNPYIWKSTDFGRTWRDISAGIPSGPVNVIKEDPANENVLYVGTDIGAYVSVDGGGSWHALPDGLPSTFVSDMIVHPRDRVLVASTHGRGMYAMDVRFIQELTPTIMNSDVHLFDVEDVTLGGGGFGGFGGGGASAFVGYWMRDAGPVIAVVKDASGATVRTLDGTSDAGFNTAVWDLTGDGEETPAGGGGFGGGARTVPAGTYTVEVTRGSTTVSASFDVVRPGG